MILEELIRIKQLLVSFKSKYAFGITDFTESNYCLDLLNKEIKIKEAEIFKIKQNANPR